jgi:hypothetical protein
MACEGRCFEATLADRCRHPRRFVHRGSVPLIPNRKIRLEPPRIRRIYPVFAVLYFELGVQFVINHHSVMALHAARGGFYLVKISVRLDNHWEATHAHKR